jgi:ABC-type phosphate/phosphonate transport system substrate-binding protein
MNHLMKHPSPSLQNAVAQQGDARHRAAPRRATRGWTILRLLPAELLLSVAVLSAIGLQAVSAVKVVRLGFAFSMFEGKDVRDATAAVEVWAMQFAKDESIKKEMKSFVYENLEDLVTSVKHQQVDIVITPTLDYLGARGSCKLQPAMVPLKRGGCGEECVIIVHAAGGISSVHQLPGKTLGSVSNPRGQIFKRWFDDLWKREVLRNGRRQELRWRDVLKEEQVVMSVFFRQNDAGLVSLASLQTLEELNPQLKRDLHVLRTSPRFVTSLMCWAGDLPEQDRVSLRDIVRKIERSPSGTQILKIFQCEKMVDFAPEQLAPVLALWSAGPGVARKR